MAEDVSIALASCHYWPHLVTRKLMLRGLCDPRGRRTALPAATSADVNLRFLLHRLEQGSTAERQVSRQQLYEAPAECLETVVKPGPYLQGRTGGGDVEVCSYYFDIHLPVKKGAQC